MLRVWRIRDDLAREVPDLDLYHRWDLEPDQAVELARGCEAAGIAVDRRLNNSEGASVGNQRGVRVYGNSHGFLSGFASSSHSISCVLLASQEEDMQRDFWYSSARDPRDLEDAGRDRPTRRRERDRAPGRAAPADATRAGDVHSGDGPRPVPQLHRRDSRRQPVPQDALFCSMWRGKSVFPDFVQIEERPHIAKALASSPFDGEGVATRDRQLVVDGVAQGYVLDSYSARKLGLRTTGNADGVHNLFIRSSTGGADARAAAAHDGQGTGGHRTDGPGRESGDG